MTPLEIVLLTVTTAVFSGVGGVLLGRRGAVPVSRCKIIHENLQALLEEKFRHIEEKLSRIERAINGKV